MKPPTKRTTKRTTNRTTNRTNRTGTACALAVLLLALGIPAALAGGSPRTIDGEVVQVMQQTENAGELDALMVRTSQGEQIRLLLGQGGSSAGHVQVGDRVRAKLSAGENAGAGYRVQSMKVRRTGETLRYRNAAGEMVQAQSRARYRDGSGSGAQDRTRARIHEPGSGDCSGPCAGGSGGRQGRGGGGRR